MLSTKTINWGDGTITTGTNIHTYATAGTYTIKGHVGFGLYAPADKIKECLIEVKQMSTVTNLREANSFDSSFKNCTKLTKVTTYNLAPTNCTNMFYKCSSLTELVGLDTWDMSNCTNISGMFNGCSSLPNDQFQVISTWNAPKINNATRLFQDCTLLESIDISNFTAMNYAEYLAMGCSNLRYIKMGGSATELAQAFRHCSSLTRIDNFNVNNSLAGHYIFHGCDKLSNIEWKGILSFGELTNNQFIMRGCPLSVDTIVGLFNILATVTEAQTLTIGSSNLAKLTDEQIAIATNKGWTVS